MEKPLYAVSHIRGHLAANYIDSGLEPPYVCLLASGGHTALLEVDGYEDVRLMGQSGDDAAGEAFDKVARVLGLPYPGGPEIQKLAREGSPVYKMPLPVFKTEGELKFSYSGLKTFVINLVHGMEQRGESVPKADVACSFQECAVEQLVRASECALRRTGMKKIAVAGGVSANERLRGRFDALGRELGAEVFYPQLRYCTDNAAMIGAAAYFLAKSGAAPAGAELDAKATVPLG